MAHITIECTTVGLSAREYILDTIFREMMGLDWRIITGEPGLYRVRLAGCEGEICMPDNFLLDSHTKWLDPSTLPTLPMRSWDSRKLYEDIDLADPVVPVIFGSMEQRPGRTEHCVELPIDVFGSAFFMLSRYEEAVIPDRDIHDRFIATSAIAFRAGFLDRPVVDEYVEILWAVMQRLWPSLNRPRASPKTIVSCDVDHPFELDDTPLSAARRFGVDLFRRGAPLAAFNRLSLNLRSLAPGGRPDAFWDALFWMMDANEAASNSVTFFFIPENSGTHLDGVSVLHTPRIRALIKEIHARGHEIGLHPGYLTYNDRQSLRRSADTLRSVLEQEGINQPGLGVRQHYLRWDSRVTARYQAELAMEYDSTLAFAECAGFRCGTSREYSLYDLVERRKLALRERPLIVMESSVIDRRYMGLGYTEKAFALMSKLRDRCHRFGGNFTLLWHNSHLPHQAAREFYQQLIQ